MVAIQIAPVAPAGGPAASAAPQRNAEFSDETSQVTAFEYRTSANGRRIRRLRIHYNVTCENGVTRETYTDVFDVPLRRNGRFRARGRYTGTADQSQNRFMVTGRVLRRRSSGRFTLTATAADRELDCRTGELTWTATRE